MATDKLAVLPSLADIQTWINAGTLTLQTIQEIINNGLFHDIIIVMLTARSVPDQKMTTVQEYVFDYIVKPFDPEYLITQVKQALQFLNL